MSARELSSLGEILRSQTDWTHCQAWATLPFWILKGIQSAEWRVTSLQSLSNSKRLLLLKPFLLIQQAAAPGSEPVLSTERRALSWWVSLTTSDCATNTMTPANSTNCDPGPASSTSGLSEASSSSYISWDPISRAARARACRGEDYK